MNTTVQAVRPAAVPWLREVRPDITFRLFRLWSDPLSALVRGLRKNGDRLDLVVAAASLAATALSGHIVRTVNLRLLDDGPPIDAKERRQLVDRWHGLNRIRLVLLAVASIALERAAAGEQDT
jgi:hypothetical protein